MRQPAENPQRFSLTPRAASASIGGQRQRCRRIPNAVVWLSLLLAGLLGVGMGAGWAQSALPAGPTNLLWTEGSVEGKIAGRFGYDLDVQYRRQADARAVPGGDYYNLIKYPSELIGRPFISYAVDSALTVSLSPLGWYGQWVPATAGLLFTPELRVVPQLNYRHPLGALRLQHRGRYEFRRRGEPTPVPDGNDLDEGHRFREANQSGRIRYRLQAAWPLGHPRQSSRLTVTFSDELFVSVGEHVAPADRWDQNRAFLGLQYVLPGNITLETGYLRQLYFAGAGSPRRTNHVLLVSVQANNLNRFFKR